MLSFPHMIVVFLVVLVVFGPQKLPELARSLGKLMAEFRKASTDFRSAFEEIDVTRYLDEMERVLRCGSDVATRNEALAILRRWQFDTMLTNESCVRAAKLLREFTELAQSHKVAP